ncbi:Methyltransferase domain-containing protein [Fictibacillus solisalsi]|uniref:Methyltransferase domain-containing protein n=1 Tax=Fictibacillus solisalsi TaxID=459525 RepID=A0A1G9UKV9_9BACL|nr:class I SAM-dependent methyltransferase [Fictibacillus solisalsi]SDM60503.1 Methyltransferase domain-containing protein [Fictibacillus solisalsi]
MYSKEFFKSKREDSLSSAHGVVPIVMDLIQPKSVLDVGCGTGTWLTVFKKKYRIRDILGVDGDYVDRRQLDIPRRKFFPYNLENPLNLGRSFDLVMSLEVAEHLPEHCAETFVQSLVNHGSVVLFSAAIPDQGGDHHVNEQWPDYWIEKFKKHDFLVIDCIRDKVWNSDTVGWWYAQNMFLFVKKAYLFNHPVLLSLYEDVNSVLLNKVHPNNQLSSL